MMQTQQVQGDLIGEQHTTHCRNHICTIVIEAEPIRFKSEESFLPGTGSWAEVDENYYNNTPTECPVEGYDWCAVNKYALNLKDEYDVHIQTKFEDDFFGYKLFGIVYGNFSVFFFPGEATINGSVATYNLTADLKYEIQYLPTRVKDAVLIDRQGFFQNTQPAETFNVWYEVTPGFTFNITNETGIPGNQSEFDIIQVIKDGEVLYEVSHVDVLNGKHWLIEQQSLEIETFGNQTFFVARINSTNLIAETEYPIYIDPQVTVSYSASYDAYVLKTRRQFGPIIAQSYRRIANPTNHLYVSTTKIGIVEYYSRADIEFNLSEIPENSTLLSAHLNITPKQVGHPINKNISFREMKKWHDDYVNNLAGNANFWDDMGDGFEYIVLNMSGDMVNVPQLLNLSEFNATKTALIIEGKFGDTKEFYAIGMRPVNEPIPTSTIDLSSFYPRSSPPDVGRRPSLIITYREPMDWKYGLMIGLFGSAGLMIYIGRKLRSEYQPIADLLMLNALLVGVASIYVASAMAEAVNVEDTGIIVYQAYLWILISVTFFYAVKYMWNVMEMMKKPT